MTAAWNAEAHHQQEDLVIARVSVPHQSVWFGGHFPNNPILPGVAILSLVEETVLRHMLQAEPPLHYDRVRFKAIVRPGALLQVQVRQEQAQLFRFEVLSDGKVACIGTCRTGQKEP